MNFICRHKFTTCTIIILVIIIILAVALLRFLLPNYGGDLYGNRLDGIDKYKVEEKKVNEMKDTIGKVEGVVSVEYVLEGRLIDITIRVKDEIEKDAAKGFADQTLAHFSDEQKGYYDIQVLISSDNKESEKYPILGYKHKSSQSFVWSNN